MVEVPNYLRDVSRADGSAPGATDLAATIDRVADRLEKARQAGEQELARWSSELAVRQAAACAQLGEHIGSEEPVSIYSSEPYLLCAPPGIACRRIRVIEESRRASEAAKNHLGTPHEHDLLCVQPAIACARIRWVAEFVRFVDERTVIDARERPSFINAHIRHKPGRMGERMPVDQVIRSLVAWARSHDAVPAWVPADLDPVQQAIHMGLTDRGRDVRGRTEKGEATWRIEWPMANTSVEARRGVAVRRALYALLSGLESPPKTAARGIGDAAFAMANVIGAIVQRIEDANPSVRRDVVRLPNRVAAFAIVEASAARWLPVQVALAIANDVLCEVALNLKWLEREIAHRCLTAPYDRAPREQRPEQTLFLEVIRHLDEAFSDAEIALLVDDGFGGTLRERTRRVADALGARRRRDRRTRFDVVSEGRKVRAAGR
jgi:hypothetical protein